MDLPDSWMTSQEVDIFRWTGALGIIIQCLQTVDVYRRRQCDGVGDDLLKTTDNPG